MRCRGPEPGSPDQIADEEQPDQPHGQQDLSGSTDNLSKHYKFLQAVANLNLFKNHLVLIGAFRRDVTLLHDELFRQSYDEAPGWNGFG